MKKETSIVKLTRLEDKIDKIQEKITNHLYHHFIYTCWAWGLAISAIAALIIMVWANR